MGRVFTDRRNITVRMLATISHQASKESSCREPYILANRTVAELCVLVPLRKRKFSMLFNGTIAVTDYQALDTYIR